MHLTANISVPQKNSLPSTCIVTTQSSACVEMHSTRPGELVGKNIWCGLVSIRDGLDSFVKALLPYCQDFDHVAVVESTYNCIAWQMSLKSEVGCFALRIQAPSVKPISSPSRGPDGRSVSCRAIASRFS